MLNLHPALPLPLAQPNFPPAHGPADPGTTAYQNSPTIGDYETHVARELAAHIDANYRTIPDGDSRGITDCSIDWGLSFCPGQPGASGL